MSSEKSEVTFKYQLLNVNDSGKSTNSFYTTCKKSSPALHVHSDDLAEDFMWPQELANITFQNNITHAG